MNENQKWKKTAISLLLIAALVIPMCAAAAPGIPAQAKEAAITYRNAVFTKSLYQNTKKIGFGADGSTVIKDSQTVRKAYRLLAGMELKERKKAQKESSGGLLTLVIYKKDGNKKTFLFAENGLYTGSRYYKITKNNPLDEIRNLSGMDKGSVTVKAVYPQTALYPQTEDYTDAGGGFDEAAYAKAYDAWEADRAARNQRSGYEKGMDAFLEKSTQQFLSGAGTENRIYSPLNVYMALGMLAELTGGNSRKQILSLAGSSDIESLRKQAADLWNANYRRDGAVSSLLAGSLWLDEDAAVERDALDRLAETYYASSYQGQMGSEQFDSQLQDWLNEQTGGMLEKQVSEAGFSKDTVLALASTIFFQARWHHEFLKEHTAEQVFHAPSGDVTHEFLHKNKTQETYYWGSRFSAVSQKLSGAGFMWFLLPNEGVSVQELLGDSQAVGFLTGTARQGWENQKHATINLAVPKFDVASSFELEEGLKALGVTDIFDEKTADFSAAVKQTQPLSVSKTEHAARTAIDEEGVTAAAYTLISIEATSAAVPEDEIDFVLDRPFLFAVTGSDGLPLFTGIVNEP